MSKLREITDKIYDCDDIEKKMQANEIYYKAADWIRDTYPDRYAQLVQMAEDVYYDYDVEWAKQIVRGMKPYGEYWSYEVVVDFLAGKGITYRCKDYYMAMNMAYNDYRAVADMGGMDITEFCFNIADRFINDEDAPAHKVAKYFSL